MARSWTIPTCLTAGIIVWSSFFSSTTMMVSYAQAKENDSTLAIAEEDDPEATVRREIETMISIVTGTGPTLEQRRDMVRALLDRNQPLALEAVANLLQKTQDSAVQQAIFQALQRRAAPDPRFAPILLELLPRVDPALIDDLAQALGRYEDPAIFQSLAELIQDPEASELARRGGVLALAIQRTRLNASVLMQVVESDAPESVREAAFTALIRLTGIREHGQDVERWRRWWANWQDPRTATDGRWYASLIEHHVRRNTELQEANARLQEQLLNTQRRLFWATATAERQELLARMLSDSLEGTRRLALDLAGQMLLTTNPFGPELRKALLDSLEESRSVEVREGAAKLLADLVDPDAAALAAQRLNAGREPSVRMLSAFALILERAPRLDGIEPLIGLLDRPGARDRASAALLSALNADLFRDDDAGHEVTGRIGARIREVTAEPDVVPTPRMVTLLGRFAGDEDWRRIEGWLAHEDNRLRQAAAAAIARDPERSLNPLFGRAADEDIQPSLYIAAAERGASPELFRALLANRPRQSGRINDWRAASLAVADRLDGGAAVSALVELGFTPSNLTVPPANGNQTWRWTLAAEILDRTLSRITDGGEPASLGDEAKTLWATAALLRAESRLRLEQAELAHEDLQMLRGFSQRLDDSLNRRYQKAYLIHQLWTQRSGPTAVEFAEGAIRGLEGEALRTRRTRLVDAFEQSIRFHIEGDRLDAAAAQLATMVAFLGQEHRSAFEPRIDALEKLLESAVTKPDEASDSPAAPEADTAANGDPVEANAANNG
ncbi:MAG: hypothetical protein JJU36_06275 [Phycisphaeraceae bacterium]|nr:hypothetical protein [Phycisphaeraceae bacterium]